MLAAVMARVAVIRGAKIGGSLRGTFDLRDNRGQGLAEYALILGLVSLICIAAVLFLSGSIRSILSNLGSSI